MQQPPLPTHEITQSPSSLHVAAAGVGVGSGVFDFGVDLPSHAASAGRIPNEATSVGSYRARAGGDFSWTCEGAVSSLYRQETGPAAVDRFTGGFAELRPLSVSREQR